MADGGAAMMLCGTCTAPGQFDLTQAARPEAAPEGWVLVDIDAVGLCGTDYHIFEGKHPYLEYPRGIGHELSGRVAVTTGAWAQGIAVAINPYISCGECRACARGKPNCCVQISVLGVHRDGGMCDRIAVPAGNLYEAGALPDGAAVLTEFLAIGAHAVRRGEPAAGDVVLREVAKALVEETRASDMVARVGGDEFVVLLPGLSDAARLKQIARRMIDRLTQPIDFEGVPCRISASIGLTISTLYDQPDGERMLSDADAALYASKRSGRAQAQLYQPSGDDLLSA